MTEYHCTYKKVFPVDEYGRLGGLYSLADVPMIFNEPTNVLYEVTHGFKLWLFDFTWKSQEWKTLAGIVTPDWLPFAIMNVLGFYFGTAAVTRR